MNTIESIYQQKLVAVIRGANYESVVPVAEALHEGGIHILEITAETPGALSLIERLNATLGDDLIVGAGTILDPETARAAIMSGARFIFSPTVNEDTIRLTKRYNVASIPGAMTPTEILTAYEAGADIVKVFPATTMGPGYIKDIHGPMPQIPLMPTGGVNLDNIQEYIQKGAIAVGLGSGLVNTKQPMDGQWLENIRKTASQFREKVSAISQDCY